MTQPGSRPRPPRSVEVAKLAGVSQKTVSRVLNDEPYVRADVRQRVLDAIQQLGYRPNSAARTLQTGRTRRIGVVTLESALHGPASLFVGIARAARASGYALSVVNTFPGDPEGITGAVKSLLNQGVDGLVLSEPIDEGPLDITVDVPVLALGAVPWLTAPQVILPGTSAEQPAYEATRHLLALGHRTVHHVAGPQSWYSARDRATGWRRALTSFNAPVPEMIAGDWTPASGYAAGRQLLDRDEVTAVFVANDEMAIGVIRAFTAAGRRVPDQLSVVGCDDIPVAGYFNPPLTTVSQPFETASRLGFAALLRAIEDPESQVPNRPAVPTRLVVRGSTAPPPSN